MRVVHLYGWLEEEVSCGGIGGIDAGATPAGWVRGRSRRYKCEKDENKHDVCYGSDCLGDDEREMEMEI